MWDYTRMVPPRYAVSGAFAAGKLERAGRAVVLACGPTARIVTTVRRGKRNDGMFVLRGQCVLSSDARATVLVSGLVGPETDDTKGDVHHGEE